VACGFVKVPARAQLTHATAHGPHPAHTQNHTQPTPTTSQARYADTQGTDLPLNKITPLS